jgi:hypothetical protein
VQYGGYCVFGENAPRSYIEQLANTRDAHIAPYYGASNIVVLYRITNINHLATMQNDAILDVHTPALQLYQAPSSALPLVLSRHLNAKPLEYKALELYKINFITVAILPLEHHVVSAKEKITWQPDEYRNISDYIAEIIAATKRWRPTIHYTNISDSEFLLMEALWKNYDIETNDIATNPRTHYITQYSLPLPLTASQIAKETWIMTQQCQLAIATPTAIQQVTPEFTYYNVLRGHYNLRHTYFIARYEPNINNSAFSAQCNIAALFAAAANKTINLEIYYKLACKKEKKGVHANYAQQRALLLQFKYRVSGQLILNHLKNKAHIISDGVIRTTFLIGGTYISEYYKHYNGLNTSHYNMHKQPYTRIKLSSPQISVQLTAVTESVQHIINVPLYDYQLHNIAWMHQLERDIYANIFKGHTAPLRLHTSFKYQYIAGTSLGMHKYSHRGIDYVSITVDGIEYVLTWDNYCKIFSGYMNITGGILSDPIGMGKTLTCIAHIINQLPLDDAPPCPPTTRGDCAPTVRQYDINNLIILPSRLIGQWKSELANRITAGKSPLKIIVFSTMRDVKLCTVDNLKKYNVVIICNKLLSNELYLDVANTLRFDKLRWNRIFIDEAHELVTLSRTTFTNPNSHKLQLYIRLCSIVANYRWCITATPLNAGIHSFYGLMMYLLGINCCNPSIDAMQYHVQLPSDIDSCLRQNGSSDKINAVLNIAPATLVTAFNTIASQTTTALPVKIKVCEQRIYVNLSDAERQLYNTICEHSGIDTSSRITLPPMPFFEVASDASAVTDTIKAYSTDVRSIYAHKICTTLLIQQYFNDIDALATSMHAESTNEVHYCDISTIQQFMIDKLKLQITKLKTVCDPITAELESLHYLPHIEDIFRAAINELCLKVKPLNPSNDYSILILNVNKVALLVIQDQNDAVKLVNTIYAKYKQRYAQKLRQYIADLICANLQVLCNSDSVATPLHTFMQLITTATNEINAIIVEYNRHKQHKLPLCTDARTTLLMAVMQLRLAYIQYAKYNSQLVLAADQLASNERTLVLFESSKMSHVTEQVSEPCVICYDTLTNYIITACRHIFCNECYAHLKLHHNSANGTATIVCPVCRQPITSSTITRMSVAIKPTPDDGVTATATTTTAQQYNSADMVLRHNVPYKFQHIVMLTKYNDTIRWIS